MVLMRFTKSFLCYQYNRAQWSDKGRIDRKGSRKMQYMGRMFLSEVGLSQVKTREFWAMILMIVIVYWMRLYCHYIGQWITLLGFGVPINKYDFASFNVFCICVLCDKVLLVHNACPRNGVTENAARFLRSALFDHCVETRCYDVNRYMLININSLNVKVAII